MNIDFDMAVVGAGVVGLAIARALAKIGKRVIVLESNENIGEETSSRNSGVIHAGIYYDRNSVKAKTCVRGRHLLYEYLSKHKVRHKKIGKYIVANRPESEQLERLFLKGIENGVEDLKIIEKNYLQKNIPEVRADIAIHSPSTGILDVHGFMNSLTGEIQDHGGDIARLSKFIFARRSKTNDHSWEIQVSCGEKNAEKIIISSHWIINAAGLFAERVASGIEGMHEKKIPITKFTKGNYFAVNGYCPFNTLIYPLPEAGGLGTHLTLDLGNQALLGPDVEPLSIDGKMLTSSQSFDYTISEGRKYKFFESANKWWPNLKINQLQPAYSGIRPKLDRVNEKAADFIIQHGEDTNNSGIINLFGIESPGLTASLAIAEIIESYVAKY